MTIFSRQHELSRLNGRYLFMLVVMSIAFVVIIGRLFHLQISRGEEYLSLSERNFVFRTRQTPLRGMIFDRNGNLLADNRPSYNLYFTPAFCGKEKFESTLNRLVEYAGLSDLEIEKTREAYNQKTRLERFVPTLIRRSMTWSEMASVEQRIDMLDGVEVRPETSRAYPNNTLASHLIGYVGEINQRQLRSMRNMGYREGDVIGKSGVEKAWEKQLRGKNGIVLLVKDRFGQSVPESVVRKVLDEDSVVEDTIPGNNMILSLDTRLQELTEKRFPGYNGAAVAMDPNTGFILAMVSKPAFDPNNFTGAVSGRWLHDLFRDPDRPLTNRVVQQHYPPGSIFKPVVGLAALKSGMLSLQTPQPCGGGLLYGNRTFRCWKAGGHGNVALHRSIVESCDVYYYRAGLKTSMDAISKMAREFGLGAKTGFKEGEETPGIIPDRAWYQRHTKTGFLPGFTLSNAIGQGDVNATPIQMAVMYAALANGGTIYQPQVVAKIESPTGVVIKEATPIVRGRLDVEPAHLQAVVDALSGVVNEPGGTAYFRRPSGVKFKVAGKTGTAQVVKQGADRGKNLPWDFRDHAWFVGYAPVTQPKIVVAVINEHAGHGSSGAAPLVMTMITYYLEQLQGGNYQAEEEGL